MDRHPVVVINAASAQKLVRFDRASFNSQVLQAARSRAKVRDTHNAFAFNLFWTAVLYLIRSPLAQDRDICMHRHQQALHTYPKVYIHTQKGVAGVVYLHGSEWHYVQYQLLPRGHDRGGFLKRI